MAGQFFITVVSGAKKFLAAIQTSAGVGDAGKIAALDATGRFDISMMPTGVGAASTATATASATITAGMATNLYTNAGALNVRPADNTTAGSEANSFATAGITSGTSGSVQITSGIVSGLSGLTPGAKLYLGTTGGVTATAPSATGNVLQVVGRALSSSTFEFNPDPDPVSYS